MWHLPPKIPIFCLFIYMPIDILWKFYLVRNPLSDSQYFRCTKLKTPNFPSIKLKPHHQIFQRQSQYPQINCPRLIFWVTNDHLPSDTKILICHKLKIDFSYGSRLVNDLMETQSVFLKLLDAAGHFPINCVDMIGSLSVYF